MEDVDNTDHEGNMGHKESSDSAPGSKNVAYQGGRKVNAAGDNVEVEDESSDDDVLSRIPAQYCCPVGGSEARGYNSEGMKVTDGGQMDDADAEFRVDGNVEDCLMHRGRCGMRVGMDEGSDVGGADVGMLCFLLSLSWAKLVAALIRTKVLMGMILWVHLAPARKVMEVTKCRDLLLARIRLLSRVVQGSAQSTGCRFKENLLQLACVELGLIAERSSHSDSDSDDVAASSLGAAWRPRQRTALCCAVLHLSSSSEAVRAGLI
ncbi:hypothetical protein GUJ93_ZPchr0012g19902 [Zizania palustris]|uniref:Uncharacterized protein n=1 Tax=Zizania palustris TaxID=103762 RepID=A0A8J5WID8_ZIZPA|nr:hypothetical protein GUJ93_ZPchr0012g19902 [Zizania palustris]